MGRDLSLKATEQAAAEAEEGGSASQPRLSPRSLRTTTLRATVSWI